MPTAIITVIIEGVTAEPAIPLVDGDPTRTRLIEAAADVFAERGYDGAGVQEIARRAGLTTGAIYGRFTGKAELLREAIEAHTTREFDELFASHQFEGQVADILRVVGSHLVEPTADDPEEGALLLEAFVAARRNAEVREIVASVLNERAALMSELVEAAKQDGSIDPALDTESLVRFCHAVALGFCLYEALNFPLPKPEPWERLIARLVAAVAATDPTETDQS